MIETLQDAAYQQMQAEVSQMTASSQLPEAQEQALDEYPMPDEQVSTPDMQEYGYFYDGMLPVTRERALKLDAAGLTVYVLHEDNTESMVFDPQEIMDHGGLFGVDRGMGEKPSVPRKGHGASGTSAGTRTGISLPEQRLLCYLSGKS